MDTISLVNENVVNFINKNYLAFKADGMSVSDEGMLLTQKYDVHTFPTLMIFTPSGRPIYEVGGYLNPEIIMGNLVQELANYQADKDFCPAHVPHFHPAATVPPIPESKVEYPEGFEFDVANQPNQEGTKGYKPPVVAKAPAPKPKGPNDRVNASDFLDSPKALALATKPTEASKNAAMIAQKQKENEETERFKEEQATLPEIEEEREIPKMTTKKVGEAGPKPNPRGIAVKKTVNPVIASKEEAAATTVQEARKVTIEKYSLDAYPDANYGVQVGAFNELSVAKKQAKLQEALGESVVMIQEAVVNNKKVYKVIVGGCENKEEAVAKITELEEKGIIGFVLGLNVFRK